MEVTGKIILALKEIGGESKATGRPWKKREYVLETFESYPKKIFFDFFGDKADQYPLQQNDTIRLSFDIESREYNGRWYTSIRGWKAEKIDESQAAAVASSNGGFPDPSAAPSFPQPAAAPGYGSAPASQPFAPAPSANNFPTPPVADNATDDLPF
jgi:hypothetical protein